MFGDNLDAKGGFAELAVAPAAVLAHKPAKLSFVEASAIPQAAAIALRGTRDVEASSRVLINGAGGGSGSLAIQVAKAAGAHVTAVDNDRKLDFMRTLGADDVIDYRREDFTRVREPFDLILDLVAHRSVFAYRRALAPGGRYLCVGGSVRTLLRVVTLGALLGRATGRRMGLLAVKEGPEQFGPLTDLVLDGDVALHIDRTFPLDATPAALEHVGEGRALGKAVVHIADLD
ncbi:MAG: NAD(P)-dependent alcohol dehydrogenase [Actinomycetota bacterium]